MKTKVLMVCLGNICRSPLAEGILKSKVDQSQVFVDGRLSYRRLSRPTIYCDSKKEQPGYYLSAWKAIPG